MCKIPNIQKNVDSRVAALEKKAGREGMDHKLKSKWGGGFHDVLVNKKVEWPQASILGCATKQQVSYDQLCLTQFIQGFLRNLWMNQIKTLGNVCYGTSQNLWRMQQILAGQKQKQLTPCSSVRWRVAR